jgi:hypothetical protein
MRSLDPKTLFAGSLLALVFFGGVALAPAVIAPSAAQLFTGSTTQSLGHGWLGGSGDLLAAAATYIGVSEPALRDELRAGKSLAEVAVANGKTRDGLIAALTTTASQTIGQLVDQKGLAVGKGRQSFGFPGPNVTGDPYAAAATYLGISQTDLIARVRAGETLAAIANATAGKSRDGLIQALVADAQARIDQAQAAGTITADRATQLKAALTDKMTSLVDAPLRKSRGRG